MLLGSISETGEYVITLTPKEWEAVQNGETQKRTLGCKSISGTLLVSFKKNTIKQHNKALGINDE